MRTISLGAILVSSLVFLTTQVCEAADTLAADDKRMLASLIGFPLPDPTGAQCVRLKARVRTVWATLTGVEREGWLVRGANGQSSRVYFSGGDSVLASQVNQITEIDFLAECQKRFGPAALEEKKADERTGDPSEIMQRIAIGGVGGDENDLTVAAWLHRLGEDDLAAKALSKARTSAKPEGKDCTGLLMAGFAWQDFAGMVHAYMVRADDEALACGERLMALKVDDKQFPQAKLILEELRRRQTNGTFAKTPSTMPAPAYDHWTVDQKVAYWITSLDEVDARQRGQPGGIDLSSDRRVAALIDIGDPAIPALIDTLEKDERLTRAVHFWRDFSQDRTVLGVREAALTAVMSILRVRVFEPVATGDTFTGRGEDETKQIVAKLRAYWAKYGKMPFDERMMNILKDSGASFEASRKAADNLANMGERRTMGTTVWSDRSEGEARGINPAIAKFNNPTAAEAILAAMDRDLAHYDATEMGNEVHGYGRLDIEDMYLSSLSQLGDKRIAPELSRRSVTDSVAKRRRFAYASHTLGDPAPFDLFAKDFAAGKIEFPSEVRANTNDADQPVNVELKESVSMLIAARTPLANAALFALTDQKHPQHDAALTQIRKINPMRFDDNVWFSHPYWILMLRPDMEDNLPTGGQYTIENNTLNFRYPRGSSSSDLPPLLVDAANRLDHAQERVCDTTAQKYSELLLGAPECHPLLKDNEERLAHLRAFLDRFKGNFRVLDEREARALKVSWFEPTLRPDIKALGRPANEEDVKQGRAIFSLPSDAKVADLKLPTVSYSKNDPKHKGPAVLIVQAEIGTDGRTVYGVIGKSKLEAISADELGPAQALADLPDHL